MTRIAVLFAILSILPVPASAHCYSIWHYRVPQRCGTARHETQPAHDWFVEITRLPPLPSLMDFAAGEPDEVDKGRLLLRAALWQTEGK